MKIKTKITLFTSGFLIATVALISTISIINIQNQGQIRLENYKQDALDDARSSLKDLVEVAYSTIDGNYNDFQNKQFLQKYYGQRLRSVVETSWSIIKRYDSKVLDGTLTLSQAQTLAKIEIKTMRYDNGSGYIWINDTSKPYAKMIMHPTAPELDGTELNAQKYNNAMGSQKNLFNAMIEQTEQTGEGFVDYVWPKPQGDGFIPGVEKLSFVKRYQPWGWILGTGVYMDDAQIDMQEKIKKEIKAMRYADNIGYFWINDNTLPYPKMVMHPTLPGLDGKILDSDKYNNAMGKDQNLFQAFAEVTRDSKEKSGFVDYLWPKPANHGLTERKPKVSFVKLHDKTGWIIGSGAYVDNIDDIAAMKQIEIEQQIEALIIDTIMIALVIIGFAIIISILFSNSLSRPIIKLTEIAHLISKGKSHDQQINETSRTDEIGELARSIYRLKNSVSIMMKMMREDKEDNKVTKLKKAS